MNCSKCGTLAPHGVDFCGNCGFPYFYKDMIFVDSYLIISGIICFALALLSINSQWIITFQLEDHIFGTGYLQDRVIFEIDNIMSVVYWVILSFAVGVMVCVHKYWALSRFVVPLLIIAVSAAPAVHMWILTGESEIPSGFEVGVAIFLILGIFEIIKVLKKWISISAYYRR